MWMNQAIRKGRELDILIYGIIGKGWWDTVDAREVNAELQQYGNDIDTINVRIHSPGGSISEGCAIYNALKHHPAKKIVYIEGECSSIATVVAMAGDEIIMSPVSRMMIHDPLVMNMSGDSGQLRAQADVLDKLKEVIINAYVTKSKLSRKEIADLMKKETHMTADEALEKGFITKVEEIGSMMNYYINNANNFVSGEMNINSNQKNNTKEVNDMAFKSKEEFRNQYPEMYAEIISEGVNQERERIKELDEMSNVNYGEKALGIIEDAKYKNFKTFGEISKEFCKSISSNNISTKEENNEQKFIERFNKKAKEIDESGVNRVPGNDIGGVTTIEEENKSADDFYKGMMDLD